MFSFLFFFFHLCTVYFSKKMFVLFFFLYAVFNSVQVSFFFFLVLLPLSCTFLLFFFLPFFIINCSFTVLFFLKPHLRLSFFFLLFFKFFFFKFFFACRSSAVFFLSLAASWIVYPGSKPCHERHVWLKAPNRIMLYSHIIHIHLHAES